MVGGWVLPPLYPAGGVPGWLAADLAAALPGGGRACFVASLPRLSLLSCPPSPKGKDIPPPPFPVGEGGDQGYFMQGASPLASPG